VAKWTGRVTSVSKDSDTDMVRVTYAMGPTGQDPVEEKTAEFPVAAVDVAAVRDALTAQTTESKKEYDIVQQLGALEVEIP
jgi:hypothetical protein